MTIRRLVLISFLSLCFTSISYHATAQDEDSSSSAGVAALQVKISQLEDEIRKLRGSLEQTQYENQQLKAQIDKNNTDINFRLGELEKKQQAAPAQQSPQQNSEVQPPDSGTLQPVQSPVTNEDAAAVPKFSKSSDLYNYAFKLLNQAKYQEAGAGFSAFTKTYPKDPLIGNAWYWLGETYYVNHDYVRSADDFRQGYESMPTGPKAGDNLLKLAMSLNALKKDKEACVILKQVTVKFSNAGSMRQRAEGEMNTIGCNQ